MKHRRPEDFVQRAVLEHLDFRGKPGLFAFHVPNGGGRSPIEGAILKGLGVRAGVPDLIILHEGRCFGLELKPPSGGRVTPAQTAAHEQMRQAGAEVAVAAGIDEALARLDEWGLLRRRIGQ